MTSGTFSTASSSKKSNTLIAFAPKFWPSQGRLQRRVDSRRHPSALPLATFAHTKVQHRALSDCFRLSPFLLSTAVASALCNYR